MTTTSKESDRDAAGKAEPISIGDALYFYAWAERASNAKYYEFQACEVSEHVKDYKKAKGMTTSPPHPNKISVETGRVKDYIDLVAAKGDRVGATEAAERLGVDRSTIYNWRKLPGFHDALQSALAAAYVDDVQDVMTALAKAASEGKLKAIEIFLDRIMGPTPEKLDLRAVVAAWPSEYVEAVAEYGREAVRSACEAFKVYGSEVVLRAIQSLSEHSGDVSG